MDDLFVSIPISARKNICISPLDRDLLEDSGISQLGNDFGLFIYTSAPDDPTAIEILAKISSREAADFFENLFRRASTGANTTRAIERGFS